MRNLIAAVLIATVLSPCAVRAQQAAPQTAPETAPETATQTSSGASSSAAAQTKERDSLEPAVDTSASPAAASDAAAGAGSAASGSHAAPSATASSARPDPAKSGKAMDHLQLGTTDITGNRELPKVLYIVPWKRSDLGDLTGKPLNSLVDETLQPIDRDVFKRENRYYGAVAQKGSGGAAARGGTTANADRSAGQTQSPAAGDER
jgi:hypothetical protein